MMYSIDCRFERVSKKKHPVCGRRCRQCLSREVDVWRRQGSSNLQWSKDVSLPVNSAERYVNAFMDFSRRFADMFTSCNDFATFLQPLALSDQGAGSQFGGVSLSKMDARCFVYYATNSQDKVMGVKEFQIGEALRKEQLELLRQEVPSQWGPKSLFELCFTFGHVDTAMAMTQKVEGCRLEAHHLKRIWSYDKADKTRFHPAFSCNKCKFDQRTCDECCFGFPTEEGIWMEDWAANLQEAADAAHKTAEQLLVHTVLEALGSGATLPFTISEEAMAHLLDLAILTGNKEAAKRCAELSHVRPLRRWSSVGFFGTARCGREVEVPLSDDSSFLVCIDKLVFVDDQVLAQLLAALSVGARLGLRSFSGFRLSLREALILSEASWADLAELLPPEQVPEMERNPRGNLFLERGTGRLRKDCLQKAQMAGWSLRTWLVNAHDEWSWPMQNLLLSLLDVAILVGQDDCAVLCAAMGAKLSQDGCELLEEYLDAAFARRPAAIAAAHQMLSTSWKSEISAKAIAIYQVMMNLSGGKCFPSHWVHQVMAYSMDVPEIVDQLDLWEEAHEWCQSVCWEASASRDTQELPPLEDVSTYGEQGCPEEPADLPPAPLTEQIPEDEKATDDHDHLMLAIRESRNSTLQVDS